jgi:hypothetical protein
MPVILWQQAVASLGALPNTSMFGKGGKLGAGAPGWLPVACGLTLCPPRPHRKINLDLSGG